MPGKALQTGSGAGNASVRDRAFDWPSGRIPLLSNLKIRTKINLLLALACVAAAVFALVSADGERRISRATVDEASFQRVDDLAADLRAQVLTLETIEQEFLRTRSGKSVEAHRALSQAVSGTIRALKEAAQPGNEQIDKLGTELAGLADQFEAAVATADAVGFTAGDGLRGALAKSAAELEAEAEGLPDQAALQSRMSMMRLAERDFMLSPSEEAAERHQKLSQALLAVIDVAHLSAGQKGRLGALVKAYALDMSSYAEATSELEGMLANVRQDMDATKPDIAALFAFARKGAEGARELQARTRASIHADTLATGIAAAVLFLALSLVLGKSIVAPVQLLEVSMGRLAKGDHDLSIPGVDRTDEIGDMARAVEVFKKNAVETGILRRREEDQRARAEEEKAAALVHMAERVEQETRQAAEAVVGQTARMAENADNMALSAKLVAEHSQTVAAAATQALANAQTVAAASEELTASIREIGTQVVAAKKVTGEAVSASGRAKETIGRLSEAAQRIGEVSDLINDIASQTNLLALNATIEAARAGEAGKGFAVVAGEVKNLSNQTSHATDEISEQIGDIQKTAQETVDAVGAIIASITAVEEVSTAVAAAIEQQGIATQEIARNVTDTSLAAHEVADRIADVSKEASNSGLRAGELSTGTQAVVKSVESLCSVVVQVVRTSTREVELRR